MTLTHQGRSQTLRQWAAELGIKPVSLSVRIHRWGLDKAFCAKREPKPRPKRGDPFGRLEVRRVYNRFDGRQNRLYALCLCRCGVECEVQVKHLWAGNTESCGCLRSELMRERATSRRMANDTRGKLQA